MYIICTVPLLTQNEYVSLPRHPFHVMMATKNKNKFLVHYMEIHFHSTLKSQTSLFLYASKSADLSDLSNFLKTIAT